MQLVFGILIGLAILMVIVVAHELGHFIAARKSGVVVEEFGIGFPPRAWAKKLKSGLVFSLNWLPIGGFCKMKGESDSDTGEGTYGAAKLWQKTWILFAGVISNFVLAAVIFTILMWTGMPRLVDNQFMIESDTTVTSGPVTVGYVVPDSPAQAAGIRAEDQIVAVAGVAVEKPSDVGRIAEENKGKTVDVEIGKVWEQVMCIQEPCDPIKLSEPRLETVSVTMNADNDENKGFLGVSTFQDETLRAGWSAPIAGVGLMVQLTGETFVGVGKLLGNLATGLARQINPDAAVREAGREAIDEAGQGVAGPVGIIGVLFPAAAAQGGSTLLVVAGIISLSLGAMNMLPIPALDGGRWLLTIIYRIRGKKLTKAKEEKINTIGLLVLFGLMILITVVDVVRIVSGG